QGVAVCVSSGQGSGGRHPTKACGRDRRVLDDIDRYTDRLARRLRVGDFVIKRIVANKTLVRRVRYRVAAVARAAVCRWGTDTRHAQSRWELTRRIIIGVGPVVRKTDG